MEFNKINSEYKIIRNEIDERCDQLHQKHQIHTKCKNGCSKCCMNFSVLPVEFHSILSEVLSNPPEKLNNDEPNSCLFLLNNSCSIYKHRPSICRSHGLPILNMDNEGENWELSYCPLNFTQVNENYFTLENGYQQDIFNSKLYLLNQKFIKTDQGKGYSENELIELRKIEEYL